MLSRPTVLLSLWLAVAGSFVAAAPCDIYSRGGTPCVAAHSTTRALFDSYTGGLYQVQRKSDGKTMAVKPIKPGGVADAAAQDSFCAGTTCMISIIYDQSDQHNHLTRAGPGHVFKGPEAGGYDELADAAAAPIKLNGHKVYGLAITPTIGYRNNSAVGTATGNGAEGMYAVFDGTDSDNTCCFDYGNAERDSTDLKRGAMEAINLSGLVNKITISRGSGNGPWIRADLEDGLWAGDATTSNTVNHNNPSVSERFVTAVLKGQTGHWALRGGDATQSSLSTFFDGPRPSGYSTMNLKGAIVLGIGGDNSIGGRGTFYEGIMTSAYPSDQTENEVQANIAAAKYSV